MYDEVLRLNLACTRRTDIKLFEITSRIQTNTRQSADSVLNELYTLGSTLEKQMTELSQPAAKALAEQKTNLREIHALIEPIPENHATIMNKFEGIAANIDSLRRDEGRVTSSAAIQASSTDVIEKIVRAELSRVVIPTVEQYLDTYKSSHNSQMEEIRKCLNQVIEAIGRLEPANIVTNNDSEAQESSKDGKDDQFQLEKLKVKAESYDSRDHGEDISSSHATVNPQTRLWNKTWSFHWKIGNLLVEISTFATKSAFRPTQYEAFSTSHHIPTRYGCSLRIQFSPHPKLPVTKGLSVI